jgi:hypothetical protein
MKSPIRIRLRDEWWLILRKSWSARFAAASAFFGIGDAIVSAVTTVYEQRWLLYVSSVLSLLAYFSRAVKQEKLTEEVVERKQEKADAANDPQQ